MTARIDKLQTIYAGWSTFSVAEVELSDGTRMQRQIEHHGNSISVLPYDPQRRVAMLVRQLRVPLLYAAGLQESLEAPAGIVEEEDPEVCARREAMEETGLRLGPLEHVVRTWALPGISAERADLFLAPYQSVDRVGRGGGLAEENEYIVAVEMSFAELAAMAEQGTLTDLKTLALVLALQGRHPELFSR